MLAPAIVAASLAGAGVAGAADPGRAEFARSSDLVRAGFAPFAVSGAGNALFGLQRGPELYLCFLADTPAAQADRQGVLVAAITAGAAERVVPNIPVVCVLTE
jgi:hypothetical protein